jgi:hypothetical protein
MGSIEIEREKSAKLVEGLSKIAQICLSVFEGMMCHVTIGHD